MPMRGELPTAAVRYSRATRPRTAWSDLIAALSNQNLQGIAIVCAIGLLLELNALLHFSDRGANLVGLMFQ